MFNCLNYVCGMNKSVKIKDEVSVKDIDADKLGKNPFVESLVIPVNKMPIKGQYMATKEIAADGKPIVLPVEIEIESERHCKIFNDAVRRKMMVTLSTRAKELYLWVLYECEGGKDYIWINKKRYMKENKVNSLNTYRSAVKELIVGMFLQPTIASDVYWINPSLFFAGSRKYKFPKNIVRK